MLSFIPICSPEINGNSKNVGLFCHGSLRCYILIIKLEVNRILQVKNFIRHSLYFLNLNVNRNCDIQDKSDFKLRCHLNKIL